MGEVLRLQPLISLKGKCVEDGKGTVNQPAEGYVDARDRRDATVHVQILRCESTGGVERPLRLAVQTAADPAGPWTNLAVFYVGSPPGISLPYSGVFPASTGGTATCQLERYLRWSVDPTELETDETWTLCFGIDVTLK